MNLVVGQGNVNIIFVAIENIEEMYEVQKGIVLK